MPGSVKCHPFWCSGDSIQRTESSGIILLRRHDWILTHHVLVQISVPFPNCFWVSNSVHDSRLLVVRNVRFGFGNDIISLARLKQVSEDLTVGCKFPFFMGVIVFGALMQCDETDLAGSFMKCKQTSKRLCHEFHYCRREIEITEEREADDRIWHLECGGLLLDIDTICSFRNLPSNMAVVFLWVKCRAIYFKIQRLGEIPAYWF